MVDLVITIGFYNAVVRVLDSLKIDVEPDYKGYLESSRSRGRSQILMTEPAPDRAGPQAIPQKPVPARPAATVVILRDGRAGIEVFMVVRHHEIDFASGALVFPGGKVDAGDADRAWAELAPRLATGADRARASCRRPRDLRGGGPDARAGRGAADMLGGREAHGLVERLPRPPARGRDHLPRPRARESLTLATDLMVPFAHWITPEAGPSASTRISCWSRRRSSNSAPTTARVVEGLWIAPQQAVRDADAGTRTLVFPTHMNLTKLARYATVAEAIAAARASPVVTVMPQVERLTGGRRRLAFPRKGLWGERNRGDRAAGHAAGLKRRAAGAGCSSCRPRERSRKPMARG